MRRLTPLTLVWRNFLYANQDGYANDPEEFMTRVSLIQNERDSILEQMLKEEPDMFLVEAAKEEIAFQVENLEEIIQEFSNYAERYHFYDSLELLQKEICEGLRHGGMESELYIVTQDWQEYAANALRVIQGMEEISSSDFDVRQHDYLMEQMMDLQLEPKAQKNLQQIKEQTINLERGEEQQEPLNDLLLEAQTEQALVPVR